MSPTSYRGCEQPSSFARLRQLQTRVDSYKPYGADVEDHPLALLGNGNVDGALMLAKHVLAMSYLDLEAHTAAARIAQKRGDKAAAAHHQYVLQGIFDSILKSGDGKTLETAYVVIAISEEYALMAHFGFQVAGQSLLNDDAGHSYDLIRGINLETKATRGLLQHRRDDGRSGRGALRVEGNGTGRRVIVRYDATSPDASHGPLCRDGPDFLFDAAGGPVAGAGGAGTQGAHLL